MFDRNFFRTPLGQAAMASVTAMVLMIAFTTQMHIEPAFAAPNGIGNGINHVELA